MNNQRPLGGFGQGWTGNNRGRGYGNMRGGYGMYGNRGGMRQQGWGAPVGGYGNSWGNMSGNNMQQGMQQGGMGAWGGMGNPMMQQRPRQPLPTAGMNYANAVKNEQVKVEPKPGTPPIPAPETSQQKRPNGANPPRKKMKLEQMGFGNMGSGFGCSLFVPNQGEEMPTMLQMGYAGEAPGMGFGDEEAAANNVKVEPKHETGVVEARPTLGKVGKVGEDMMSVNKNEKKAEWPPALMDYISRCVYSPL